MKKVTLSKKSFVSEHRELVKTLKSGNKKKIKAEIKEQSSELKRIIKKK